ncbi:MAG: HAD-IA family hydrolase [Deferrisomatales bacterium]
MRALRGTLEPGRQEAAGFLSEPWVVEGIRSRAGFTPFPGTLNLRLADPPSQELWNRLRTGGGGLVLPPGRAGYCAATLFPVRVGGLVQGVIVWPHVEGYPPDVVEVVAAEHLRSRLGLGDGDGCVLELVEPTPCVLFDLEGTLVDFQWRLEAAEDELRGALGGLGLDPAAFAGDDYAGIRHRALDLAPPGPQRDRVDPCLAPIYDRYDLDAESRWSLRDGAEELLSALAARGFATGLVTNIGRAAVDRALARLGLAGRFAAVVTRDDVGRMKPSGEGIRKALAALGGRPETAWMVGDSRSDLLAARDAGVRVALVAGGESRLRAVGGLADAAVEGLDQVLDLVAGPA